MLFSNNTGSPVIFVVALSLHNNASRVEPVILGEIFIEQQPSVGNVRCAHCGREEYEREDAFPDLHLAVGWPWEDEVEPDVGKDGPRGRDEEHA